MTVAGAGDKGADSCSWMCSHSRVPIRAQTSLLFPRPAWKLEKGQRGRMLVRCDLLICLWYLKPLGISRSLEAFPSLFLQLYHQEAGPFSHTVPEAH